MVRSRISTRKKAFHRKRRRRRRRRRPFKKRISHLNAQQNSPAFPHLFLSFFIKVLSLSLFLSHLSCMMDREEREGKKFLISAKTPWDRYEKLWGSWSAAHARQTGSHKLWPGRKQSKKKKEPNDPSFNSVEVAYFWIRFEDVLLWRSNKLLKKDYESNHTQPTTHS